MKTILNLMIKIFRNPLASLECLYYLLRYFFRYGTKLTIFLLRDLFADGNVPNFFNKLKRAVNTKLVIDNYSNYTSIINHFKLDDIDKNVIFIGLLEHMGDIICSEPIIRHLRKKHPKNEIFFFTRIHFKDLVENNPNIDRVFYLQCITEWMMVKNHHKHNVIYDLHVNGKACIHCNIELEKKDGNPHINGYNYFDYGNLLSVFSLAAGLKNISGKSIIYEDKNYPQIFNFKLPNQFVVTHFDSNETIKNLRPQLLKNIIRYLNEKKIYIVNIGIKDIFKDLEVSYGKDFLFNYAGQTTLKDILYIIKKSSGFVGIDSGPAHIANVYEKDAVVFLGPLKRFHRYNPFNGLYENEKFIFRLNKNNFDDFKKIFSKNILDNDLEVKEVKTSVIKSVKQDQNSDDNPSSKIKSIAFYLPQFHPIEQNNQAWGEGFTEWTNVTKAKKYYPSQHQPRLPANLGFYDLRIMENMLNQFKLAQSHGIHGFCYYFYWFNGKKLLNLPIRNMFENKDHNMPYCFCWANENWTKRWDGHDKEILVEQKHNFYDDEAFINHMFEYFNDPRYIRINNKPLLLLYRTDLFPNINKTVEIWRNEAAKAGFSGLFLVRAESNDPYREPKDLGFDASYEIPTFILPDTLKADKELIKNLKVNNDFKGRIFDYKKIVEFYSSRVVPYKRYPAPMLAWDNTARHNERATIFENFSISSYKNWLESSCKYSDNKFKGEEKIVFINAWNEWAEGSYLEPDSINGINLLKATAEILRKY